MNVNFEMALQYINLGSYEKAENELKTAIAAETEKGNLSVAAEYRCVLLNDGRIGDHIDDPVQPVFNGVLQRKGERSHGFSPAGRHRERIYSAGSDRSGQALLQNFTAAAVQLGLRRKPFLNMGVQTLQKHRKGIIALPVCGMV